MNKNITELFCFIDDFCNSIDKNFTEKLLPSGKKTTRTPEITHSEILTIILLYQQSRCEDCKSFYTRYLKELYGSEFPNLPSYSRFIRLKSRVLWYLALLLQWFCEQAKMTGISYIDATSIAVCHPKRTSRNKVFKGLAKIGKTTYGWFFGFKLHLVINEIGEIQSVTLTKGNVDDRKPVPNLTEKLTGLLFGDKGYIKKELFEKLFDRGLKLVTKVKKGMKNALISLKEKILLRKRPIIETVFSLLKNKFELEHSRHRSPINFLVHVFSTLVSYSMGSKKPRISTSLLLNPQLGLAGKDGVEDHELLGLAICSGHKMAKNTAIAEKLIHLFSGIGAVISSDYHQLVSTNEVINDSMIARIFCIKEILDRILRGKLKELPIIDNEVKLRDYLKLAIGQSRKENLRVMYLNQSYHLIHEYVQDSGAMDRLLFDIRGIIKMALLLDSTSIIIAHNHPSGDPKPSKAERQI